MSDLIDAEFVELDELLAEPPPPFQSIDVVTLDGYLCGVLVQPERIELERWLPGLFDYDGQELPEGVLDTVDADWLGRVRDLVRRRHDALRRSIAEDGWFHPFVLEPDDAVDDRAGDEASPAEGAEGPSPISTNAPSAAEAVLPPASRALMPWVAGFELAMSMFPGLAERADDAVMNTLARLYRHLPAETAQERELVRTMDRNLPLASLDAAIEDLVNAVVELSDLTESSRYRVDTVRRAEPKVGRNDPCPCCSGRKYKHCHGAG